MLIQLYSDVESIEEETINKIKEFDKESISDFFKDPFTFNIGIVNSSEDVILGAGIVRVVNEFKLIMNPNLTNFNKAKVINKLIEKAKELSQCNEIIVEITQGGSHYENLLIKHFNFQPTTGNVLRHQK